MLSLSAGYPSCKHTHRKKKKMLTISEKMPYTLPPVRMENVQSKFIGIIGTANLFPMDKETKMLLASVVPKMSKKTMQPVKLHPIFEGSYCEKLRSSHHYKLVPSVLDPPKLRRLGSGLMPSAIDSAILTDLMSLLDSHRQPNFDADLPAIDNQSHSSEYGGSFKGANIPTHSVKGHSAKNRSWPYGIDEAGREYIGMAPVVTLREGSSSPSGSVTSLPQLPAIKKHPLTPIKDVSRETTQNITLPPIHGADGIPMVNVEPPTPQHSTLMKTADQEQEGREVHVVPTTDEDGEWRTAEKRHPKRQKGDHSHHGSMESIPHSQVQSIPSKNRPHWKGSQQSLKSVGSRKGRVDFEKYSTSGSSQHSETGSVIGEGSLKGSIICAPDGEIISVGGSVGPRQSDVASMHDVMQVNKRVGDGEVEESPVGSDLDEPEEWKESRRKVHTEIGVEVTDKKHSRKESSASEQMLVDALTEHAQKIAQSVLRHSESGMNLEADIRDAIEEIMRIHRTNSADVRAADYREQIRRNLTTAVANAAGLTPESLPADAEISPELLEALANQSLTPEDIEIVHDPESGRSTLRSKSQLSKAMGGVKEGHIYVSPGGAEEPPVSIPSERVTIKDVGDVDVISYGVPETGDLLEQDQKSKGSSKTPSVKDGEIAVPGSSRKPSEGSQGTTEDAFAQAVQRLEEQKTPDGEAPVSDTKSPDVASEHGSTKTGMSKVSQKSEESKKSRDGKKKPVSLEDRDEFVVGKPKQKPKVDKPLPPKKEPRKKKEKKVKIEKKKVEEPPPPPPKEPTPPPKEPAKAPSPKAESPEPFESPAASPDNKSDDMEFVFVRDTTQTPEVKKDTPLPREPTSPSIPPAVEEEPDEDDDEDPGVKLISNKDARLAKRAAAAAKKREEVERRRREKEEDVRRQKEEAERQDQLRREMEEERKRRDEERRLRKLREEEERKKEENAAAERERRKQMEMEREKRAKEEYQRKLEEMRRKQAEEEQRRLEALLERQREDEERRLQEEEMMSKMAEQERLEYERRKREEEELRRQREEEEKRRREEEAQRALEEAKRLAEEMARRQAELEARLRFNRDLQLESHGLTHTQDITRMFVFSYFELLQWLGLDIPEFELQKLAQF